MHITADLIREALTAPSDDSVFRGTADASRARAAAVMVPILFDPEPRALLVLRGSQLAEHPGEVGFPGGKPEPGDADLLATALREMHEEVALSPDRATQLGALMAVPVITGRFLIHPFVAAIAEGPPPRAASPEIARIIHLPLAPLITGELPTSAVRGMWRGAEIVAPHFEVDGAVLYGASAYIFYELLAKLAARLGRTLPAPRIETTAPWGDRYTR